MRSPKTVKKRRGMAPSGILVSASAIVLLAAGAWWLRGSEGEGGGQVSGDLFEVRQGSFDITVPTSGELAAISQIEIKNQLDSRAIITEVVDEGVRVSAGDVLVRFNDDTIRENIKDAEDALEVARNDLETATATLEIQKKTRESRMAQASLNIRLADLALKSWEAGDDVTTRQDLALRVETAQKEFDRASERYDAAQRLRSQEFLSEDELKQDEITLIKARSELQKAKLQKEVYEEYDAIRFHEEKLSDLQQARDEFDREQQRLDAEVRSDESNVESRKRRLDSRQERLDKWLEQLEHCTIIAPAGGLVVYASSLSSGRWGRNEEDPPQVGTEVSPNRTIMILPDVSQMIAAVKVNEARSGQIQPGQKATVVSDALPDTVLTGEVLNVGVLAESGGWRDPNRRDYTVRILLDGGNELGLKPSMRCKANIAVGRVEGAMHVPIQAIFRDGPSAYVYVQVSGGWAQRAVGLGRASDLYVELTDGVQTGQYVLLREPDAAEIVERLDDTAGSGPRVARGPGGEGFRRTASPGGPSAGQNRPRRGDRAGGDRQRRPGGSGDGAQRRGGERQHTTDGERPQRRAGGEKPSGSTAGSGDSSTATDARGS
ncbi:MAG: efflux RND transporter periplasmic adaptor subunit [Planctomycetota bacterium]